MATNFQNGKGTMILPKVISLENLQPPTEVKALGPSLARPFGEAYLAIFPLAWNARRACLYGGSKKNGFLELLKALNCGLLKSIYPLLKEIRPYIFPLLNYVVPNGRCVVIKAKTKGLVKLGTNNN